MPADAETKMDWSPRSRTTNRCSRSPASRGRALGYEKRFAPSSGVKAQAAGGWPSLRPETTTRADRTVTLIYPSSVGRPAGLATYPVIQPDRSGYGRGIMPVGGAHPTDLTGSFCAALVVVLAARSVHTPESPGRAEVTRWCWQLREHAAGRVSPFVRYCCIAGERSWSDYRRVGAECVHAGRGERPCPDMPDRRRPAEYRDFNQAFDVGRCRSGARVPERRDRSELP